MKENRYEKTTNETRKKNQKKPAIRGINPGGADDNLTRFSSICRKLAEG